MAAFQTLRRHTDGAYAWDGVCFQLFSGSLSSRCLVPVGVDASYDDAWPVAEHLGETILNTTTPMSWWLPSDQYQEICSSVAVRSHPPLPVRTEAIRVGGLLTRPFRHAS